MIVSSIFFLLLSHSLCISLSLYLTSLPCLVLTCTICFSPYFLFSYSLFLSLFFQSVSCWFLLEVSSIPVSFSLFGLILCCNLFLSFSSAFHLSLASSFSLLFSPRDLFASLSFIFYPSPSNFFFSLALTFSYRSCSLSSLIWLLQEGTYLYSFLSLFLLHSHSILYIGSFFIFYMFLFLTSSCRIPYACSSLSFSFILTISRSFYPCFSLCIYIYISSIGRIPALCSHSLLPYTIGLSPDSCWLYPPKGQLCEISIWRSVEIRYLKRQPCILNKCVRAVERREES